MEHQDKTHRYMRATKSHRKARIIQKKRTRLNEKSRFPGEHFIPILGRLLAMDDEFLFTNCEKPHVFPLEPGVPEEPHPETLEAMDNQFDLASIPDIDNNASQDPENSPETLSILETVFTNCISN